LVEPGHVLKYSAFKNLASLAEKREQWEKSVDAYLQVRALASSALATIQIPFDLALRKNYC